MDIHKPKAAHSWREFLIEIGTIICGILIALGLEQAVEAIHRNTETREAREALREEIKENGEGLLFGIEENRCLSRQMDGYVAWAAGGAKAPELRTRLALSRFSTWDTVKAGAVPHMTLPDRLALAHFYDDLSNEQKVVELERDAARVLFAANDRTRLDGEDARQVLNAVSVLHRLTHFYIGNADNLLRQTSNLGAGKPALDDDDRKQLDYLCGRSDAHPTYDPR